MKEPASEARRRSAPSSSSGAAEAALRDALHLRLAGLGGEEVAVDVGLDVARRERVHADAVARPLERVLGRHLDERGLGGGVGGDAGPLPQPEDRGDVDDGTGTLVRHQPPDGGDRDTAGAVEVDGEDLVPVGVGLVERGGGLGNTAVVDDDVDGAECGLGLGEGGVDRCAVGHVHGDDDDAAAEAVAERLHRPDAAGGEDDGRAGSDQHLGETGAEGAGGTGDQCGAAFERKAGGEIGCHPSASTRGALGRGQRARVGDPGAQGGMGEEALVERRVPVVTPGADRSLVGGDGAPGSGDARGGGEIAAGGGDGARAQERGIAAVARERGSGGTEDIGDAVEKSEGFRAHAVLPGAVMRSAASSTGSAMRAVRARLSASAPLARRRPCWRAMTAQRTWAITSHQ